MSHNIKKKSHAAILYGVNYFPLIRSTMSTKDESDRNRNTIYQNSTPRNDRRLYQL